MPVRTVRVGVGGMGRLWSASRASAAQNSGPLQVT